MVSEGPLISTLLQTVNVADIQSVHIYRYFLIYVRISADVNGLKAFQVMHNEASVMRSY